MLPRAELVDLGCGLACISSATHQSSARAGDMNKTYPGCRYNVVKADLGAPQILDAQVIVCRPRTL
jgi:hypothetical protein